MSRKFDTAVDDCLELLRSGASVEDCLARYPEHAEELRPLVSLAFAVRRVPTPRPDPASVHANRVRMLDALQESTAGRPRRGPLSLVWARGSSRGMQARGLVRTGLSLTAIILLVTLAAGVLFTSAADSLPGQTLYPAKRFSENLRLSLTLSPAVRQQLQAEYLVERQREIRQVLDAGYQAVLEFRGELTEIGDGYWVVGGLRVEINDDTLAKDPAAVGAIVLVRALSTQESTLRALELQVLAEPLLLTVEASDTPTPSATPTAPPTSGVTPTATPSATPAPSATPTATLTPSVTPTASPSPTTTYIPTHTEEPEPTDLPDEDETPEPDSTDSPDEDDTSEPDSTDSPDEDGTDEIDASNHLDLGVADESLFSGCPCQADAEEPGSRPSLLLPEVAFIDQAA